MVNFVAVMGLIALTRSSNIYQYTNLIALYSFAAHYPQPVGWIAVPASLAGVLYYFASFPEDGSTTMIIAVALFWIVTWLAGRVAGGFEERNQLRAERDLSNELAEARRARLQLETERTRMAQELHDIVGHTLNVMLVHAGAARRALPQGAADAERALLTIETTGRSAMDDLDRVLGFLQPHDDGPGRSPLPGIDDLAALTGNAADDRLDVSLDVDLDVDSVPRSVQLTVYRIAQEALTNVLKHASASAVVISVRRRGGAIVVEIADDGAGLDGTEPGRGVIGMQERAELHGGELTTSVSELGGALVRGRVPLGAAEGPPASPATAR